MSEPAEKKIPRASTPAAPKNEEQLAYEAKMSSLAMDQMAEGAVVKNPDGTIALVVLNTSEETKVVNLRMNGTTTRLTLWGNSIATVLI